MIICGLKLTHDGAVALIEDGRLVFSIEMEKLANNTRFESIEDTAIISRVLLEQGYRLADVDFFVVDGWGGTDQDALAIQPRLEIGTDHNLLSASDNGRAFKMGVAPYMENHVQDNLLREWGFAGGLWIAGQEFPYSSYMHAAGHVIGAYCTSPFAAQKESSYILAWDGGMYPKLYFFDAQTGSLENLGPIFLFIGNIYTIFSQHFGPFKVKGNFAKDNLSVAGKVMAYIALGQVREELFGIFERIYVGSYDKPMGFANQFANEFKAAIAGQGYSDEDILHSFHAYLERLLLEKLAKKVGRYPRNSRNLCLVGGCALNIKWNSYIRNSGLFEQVFVPPFPNDSGSALGVACCKMLGERGATGLEWSVYSGPGIVANDPGAGWSKKACDLRQLAQLLHRSGEAVVFLNGRSELGPRALGNRSILAAATSPAMKDHLNVIKKRESYRPVSPICLEEYAADIFAPGIPDPYMLFDHHVRQEWVARIPAVIHLDGSARLQTVNQQQNPVVVELLEHYRQLSGIPLLCNTSANLKGCGFFPDVFSATGWDETNYVWCDHILYEKESKKVF